MMNTPYSSLMLIMFSFTGYLMLMVATIFFTMSVDSIFMKWLALEVTMILFTPVMVMFSDSPNSLSALKYFISQSPASALLLFSFFLTPFMIYTSKTLMLLSVLFKLGVPPFQGWAVNLLKDLGSMSMYLMLSVQKFIPLSIFEMLGLKWMSLGILIALTQAFIFMSLNNVSSFFFLILISSIANTFWVLANSMLANTWLEFMIAYCVFLMILMYLGWLYGVNKMSPSMHLAMPQASLMCISLLNLAGLPPLGGFFLKLFMLKSIISTPLVAILLVILSLTLMYIYISFCYYMFCFKFTYYISSNKTMLKYAVTTLLIFTINPTTFLLS